jgi:formylglycine-generating enzyme required for sulfatase activity
MSTPTSFAALLERFFTQRLMQQRQASPRATGAAWVAPNCPMRVIRGGCWAYHHSQLRSARREAWEQFKRSYCVAFRVARTLVP